MRCVRILLLSISLVIFLAGCGKEKCPTEPENQVKADPSFSADVQPIFSAHCATAGCHDATATAGLNLSENAAYENIVGKKSQQNSSFELVKAGDSENSYLVMKLENRQNDGSSPMPLGATPLDSVNIQLIKNWIDKGAKNN